MRITVGNIKGGVGKTTTAVFLALQLAADNKRVLLVDADPEQASAFGWSEDAGDSWPDCCSVVAFETRNLYKRLSAMIEQYDHLVIDTGPKNPLLLRQALALSDHFVIPMSPSPMEMREIKPLLDIAEEVSVIHPVATSILLTKTRSGTRSKRDARQALKDMKMPVLTAETSHREFYKLAFGTVPEISASDEYAAVLNELRGNREI